MVGSVKELYPLFARLPKESILSLFPNRATGAENRDAENYRP
jgi:hypothetical protein